MSGRIIQGYFPFGARILQPGGNPVDGSIPARHDNGIRALVAPGRPPLAYKGIQSSVQRKGARVPTPLSADRHPTVAGQGDGTGLGNPAGGSFAVDPAHLGLVRSGGQLLPRPLLAKMESAFAADFSRVRVHVGPQATRIGALAFTMGEDLYFAPGQYQPESARGQQLIGHELAHVIQQRQGRVRSAASGVSVVTDPALEAEADRLGMRAAMSATPVRRSSGSERSVRTGQPTLQRMEGGRDTNPHLQTPSPQGVDNSKWLSNEAREERDKLSVVREILKETLHHKTPRQLLGYFWTILTSQQKRTLMLVLDVPGRRGFLSMGSNLLLGPTPGARPDEPGADNIDGENIAKFDGNRTTSGNLTPRSARHHGAYIQLLEIFRTRANSVSKDKFYSILNLLEEAEAIHYSHNAGLILENPNARWTDNNAKALVPPMVTIIPQGTVRSARATPTDWERYAKIKAGASREGVSYYDVNSEMTETYDLKSGHADWAGGDSYHPKDNPKGFRNTNILTTRATGFEFDPVPGKRSLKEQQTLHIQSLMPQEEDRAEFDRFKDVAHNCGVCGTKTSMTCAKCRQAYYCCKEHQRLAWPEHRKNCVSIS